MRPDIVRAYPTEAAFGGVPDLSEREGPRGLGARGERAHRRRDAVVGVGGGGTGDGVQLLSTEAGIAAALADPTAPGYD